VWGCERTGKQTFEELIEKRWDEEGFVQKICGGYKEGVWEKYGEALRGFETMEKQVLSIAAEGRREKGKDDEEMGSAATRVRDPGVGKKE